MLDITSYRRKDKLVAPLTVMREFYYDYCRTSQKKIRLKSCNDVDPLARQTLSIERFNKCLREIQNSNQQQKIPVEEPQTQIKKHSLKTSKQFYKKQSGCFKSTFSTSIPFLKCNLPIKDEGQHQERPPSKENKKRPEISNILFSRRKLQIRNPTKQFKQMCEQKQGLERKARNKKEKLKTIREKWILNNLYHKEALEGGQTARAHYRIRDLFSTTQDNIFPR